MVGKSGVMVLSTISIWMRLSLYEFAKKVWSTCWNRNKVLILRQCLSKSAKFQKCLRKKVLPAQFNQYSNR